MLFGSYFYVCKKIAYCKPKSVHMQVDRKKELYHTPARTLSISELKSRVLKLPFLN